jgi:hypothetical protein
MMHSFQHNTIQQGQEPGTAAQVCEFAKTRFQVTNSFYGPLPFGGWFVFNSLRVALGGRAFPFFASLYIWGG